jgi:hypothetical protein
MLKPVVACLLAGLALPAIAGEGGDIARDSLYAGTLEQGLEALRPHDERFEQDARFGIGMIRFVQAVEHFAQGLYRYGFAAPDAGPIGPAMVIPVPANPEPEQLTYDKARALLARLVADMDVAKAALLDAGKVGDYVVPIDVMKIRIDVNEDGRIDGGESVGGVLASMFGGRASHELPPELTVGFDRADAYWLAGYSQVVAAQADFLLAHDFHELVNATFHRLFPKAGLPMQDYTHSTSTLMLDPQSDNAIADALAAIHTLSFPVVEPARLKGVLERLRDITALSRQNWEAILAETDDDHELIPSPRQTALLNGPAITDETVGAWLATLDTTDQILAGELLIPHWRFQKGFDLKAYFENATRTDLVMLITGYDALPFLKDGPIASAGSFAEAGRVFGDALWGYAFWFN